MLKDKEEVRIVQLGHSTGLALDIIALAHHAVACPQAAHECVVTLQQNLETIFSRGDTRPLTYQDREAKRIIEGILGLIQAIKLGVH